MPIDLANIRSSRPQPKLCLHCGAHEVPRSQITTVQTPDPTDTWVPIPHHQLIQTVESTLKATKLRVGVQSHSLTHDGMRYFGLMEIIGKSASEECCWVLGLRNSHDKTFPAGLVAGNSVFVCDNLSFSGEVKFARKHTRFILRDLPQLAQQSVGQLMVKWHDQDKRIAAYKDAEIEDSIAHDLIIRACDVGVCANSYIPGVLHEWREPKHDAFEPRNAWSLFNAFTEALKGGNLAELPKRTEALHGLLDVHVGLN